MEKNHRDVAFVKKGSELKQSNVLLTDEVLEIQDYEAICPTSTFTVSFQLNLRFSKSPFKLSPS